jgi:hypothetical protein
MLVAVCKGAARVRRLQAGRSLDVSNVSVHAIDHTTNGFNRNLSDPSFSHLEIMWQSSSSKEHQALSRILITKEVNHG